MTTATAIKKKAGHLLEQVPAVIPTPEKEIKMSTTVPQDTDTDQADPAWLDPAGHFRWCGGSEPGCVNYGQQLGWPPEDCHSQHHHSKRLVLEGRHLRGSVQIEGNTTDGVPVDDIEVRIWAEDRELKGGPELLRLSLDDAAGLAAMLTQQVLLARGAA